MGHKLMVVDKIKVKMKENGVTQEKLADLMSMKSGKPYNQSMISKHLSHDKKLSVEEEKLILELIDIYESDKQKD